jgi:hypothetical protein
LYTSGTLIVIKMAMIATTIMISIRVNARTNGKSEIRTWRSQNQGAPGKSEYRNPKSETNPNIEKENSKRERASRDGE